MEKISLAEIKLIGLSLGRKTTNENGQSAIDCGSHWQKFEAGKYAERILNEINDEIFAVYHDYQSDHTGPYSYFIGCKVDDNTVAPEVMDSLVIPKAEYVKIIAKGIIGKSTQIDPHRPNKPWTDKETGETMDTFAIVTTQANSLMEQIHNTKKRMPTILTEELAWEWIMSDLSEERIKEITAYQTPSSD